MRDVVLCVPVALTGEQQGEQQGILKKQASCCGAVFQKSLRELRSAALFFFSQGEQQGIPKNHLGLYGNRNAAGSKTFSYSMATEILLLCGAVCQKSCENLFVFVQKICATTKTTKSAHVTYDSLGSLASLDDAPHVVENLSR